MSQPVIQVDHLNKAFRISKKKSGFLNALKGLFRTEYQSTQAVDDLSFSVEEGELLAFIGPNGAGKSTTIKMLTGILYPTSGTINVLGLDPSRQRQKLAFQISSLFGQKSQLWYHLPALDSYQLFARIYELDIDDYKKRLDFLVDAFQVKDLISIPVRKLSLGQRMRCEIIASLLHKPKIIFLDEPTIGLDIVAKQQIRDMIQFLNQEEKVTVFLTSHDAGDIETLAKRTIIINYGRIVTDEPTQQLKEKYIHKKLIKIISNKTIENVPSLDKRFVLQDPYTVTIEIDIQKQPLNQILASLVNQFDIKDMTIVHPSMEEIIADIYQAQDYANH